MNDENMLVLQGDKRVVDIFLQGKQIGVSSLLAEM
jgi:hypothetical protein